MASTTPKMATARPVEVAGLGEGDHRSASSSPLGLALELVGAAYVDARHDRRQRADAQAADQREGDAADHLLAHEVRREAQQRQVDNEVQAVEQCPGDDEVPPARDQLLELRCACDGTPVRRYGRTAHEVSPLRFPAQSATRGV
jgi:hypothetical protein